MFFNANNNIQTKNEEAEDIETTLNAIVKQRRNDPTHCDMSYLYRHGGEIIKANCYAFALALPDCKPGGLVDRSQKSTPGGKPECRRFFPPMVTLSPPIPARRELTARLICDNPQYVKPVPTPYTLETAFAPIKGEFRCKKHLMACVFGEEDFHFLRRITTFDALRMLDRMQPLTDNQLRELQNGARTHRYVWVHARGWSTPSNNKTERSDLRKKMGMLTSGYGSITIVDARGRICWSPYPLGANIKNHYGVFIPLHLRIDLNYGRLNYNQFAGLYEVHTGMATVDKSHDLASPICKMLKARQQSILAKPRPPAAKITYSNKNSTQERGGTQKKKTKTTTNKNSRLKAER